MAIYVVNKKYYKQDCEYVGRPSKLGNPYSHLDYGIAKFRCRTVEESISKYRYWIYQQIKLGNQDVKQELRRLIKIAKDGDLILGCWCVPFTDCHAEIIKELIQKAINYEKNSNDPN